MNDDLKASIAALEFGTNTPKGRPFFKPGDPSLLDQYLDHVLRHTAFRCGKMEMGKVRATLLREQGFNGEVMPRHVYAEKRVAAGNVEIDYKRKHYKNTVTGTLFLFSDVTLAVVDYTEWLLSRKGAA